jgi:linoleoyl-CoA desaturase
VVLALWALAWTTLVVVRPGVVLGLLALAALTLSMVLIGFSIHHDANHDALLAGRRRNRILGWIATDAVLGFSSYVWRVKHNIAHNTYTNVDGHDDDLAQTPFARFMLRAALRSHHRQVRALSRMGLPVEIEMG